jgi:hypothetical protein
VAPGEVVTVPSAAVFLTASVRSNSGTQITSDSPEAAATNAKSVTIPVKSA